ncbi:MAG: DNA methyltransferase [Candidatus Woesearchaeota archaeon]
MEVQEILGGKKRLIEFLKEKGFNEEKEYSDEEYKEGIFFRIDKRKLLVIYEVYDEEKIKEIKDHFLMDRGLSYCIICIDTKLIFFRSFGETKHFIYSERTKNNPSKVDKLKNITNLDYLFQSKDISGLFYEAFKLKRNLLVQNIKNDVEPIHKYLIAQKIFDRFFFIYFLCHKGIIKFNDGGKISGESLFTKILLKKGNFLQNLKKLFHLFNSQEKNLLEIGDYQIVVPYLNGGLFRPDVLEQDLDIKLDSEQWGEIFEFLNSYHWIIEDVKAIEENEEKILTPEILGHVYERSVVEWESEGFEKEAENAVKKITERKKKGVYYTPESITDYISNNTILPCLFDKLGKFHSFEELIESKNKKDMKDALKILDEIKVIDPACGSGAFLIKASEVLLGLKRRLLYELKEKKNFYELKLDIITENIYGVDFLAGAIEISKLRLWLWLISDYEDNKHEIKALPNIEYNLKVGNSLVGWLDEKLVQMPMNTPLTEKVDGIFTGLIAFSENSEGTDLKKARELLKTYKLNDYIEAYYILYKIYRKTHGLKAENLRSIIETIRKSIYHAVTPSFLEYINFKLAGIDYGKAHKEQTAKYKAIRKNPPISDKEFSELQVFHWRIDFGHIILNGGFDVVIGNPPYVCYDLNEKYKEIYKILSITHNTKSRFKNQFNLATMFLERTYFLLAKNGQFSMIVPHSISRSEGYYYIRNFIQSNSVLREITDAYGQFQGVTLEMIIIFYQKCIKNNYQIKCYSMREDKTCFLPINEAVEKGYWILYYDDIYSKISKFKANILDGDRGIDLDKEITPNGKYYYLGGKNIKRFYLDYDAYSAKDKTNTNPYLEHKQLVVITQFGTLYPRGVIINTDKNVPSGGCVIVSFDELKFDPRYILAILNSRVVSYFFYRYILNSANLTIHLDGIYLMKIPIPALDLNDQKKFSKLVDEILAIKSKESTEKLVLENKLNSQIYKLYNLESNDINLIENWNNEQNN